MERDKILILQILLADIVLLTATVVFTFIGANYLNPSWLGGVNNVTNLITLFDICLLACNAFYPSIIQNRIVRIESIIRRSLIVSGMLLLLVSLCLSLVEAGTHFPRTYILITVALYAVLSLIERIAISKTLKYFRRNKRNTRQIVIVGKDKSIAELIKVFCTPHYGYEIEGVFYDGECNDEAINSFHRGTLEELYPFLSNHSEIKEVYAHFPENQELYANMLSQYCENHIIRFFLVPSFDFFKGNVSLSVLDGVPVISRHDEPLTNPINKITKRCFDFLFALFVLLTIFPWIFIIVSIIIKIQSPGPIFFIQERTGMDGKIFKCIKFRTMHVNDLSDTLQATEDDPRKFPFGDFMRRCNIDELPQFINVLLGDMSIVGPRPHMLKHTSIYSNIINRYMIRHLAKPGITGLAQVSGYRGETKFINQMEGRIRFDIEYIENWTFLLDLKIIYKTVANMFGKEENAY